MDASNIRPRTVVPASRRLTRKAASHLVRQASKVIVVQRGQITEFSGARLGDEVVEAMLGPTGNLRAPTIQSGKTVLVGFDEETYREVLGQV